MTTITIPDGNTISVTSFDNNSYLVQANTQLVIANGGIVSGLITVTGNPAGRGGGNLEVQSGGTALNTIVSSGGYTRVSGAALNTTISSGGNLEVDAGGSALTTVVSSAGNMYQASGGYVSGLTVSRGRPSSNRWHCYRHSRQWWWRQRVLCGHGCRHGGGQWRQRICERWWGRQRYRC